MERELKAMKKLWIASPTSLTQLKNKRTSLAMSLIKLAKMLIQQEVNLKSWAPSSRVSVQLWVLPSPLSALLQLGRAKLSST
jgi:hypothetical protein